jgi:hypothetical protein
MKDMFESAKEFAVELEKIVGGDMVKCPECGEIIEAVEEDDNGNYDYSCGCSSEIEGDEYTIYDYISDRALEIEVYAGLDKRYHGAKIMVSYGGPTVYVNTKTQRIEYHWGSYETFYRLDREVTEAIDDAISEMWQ